MNTMIAEKPVLSKKEIPAPAEHTARMPVAAGLLPYGLALESLLRP